MSASILCRVRRAESPLRVEALDLGLYSIEELCYFLEHDLSLVDDDFFSAGFCDWLREELDLPELADRIAAVTEKEYELIDVVMPVMDEIHYADGEKKREIEQRIRDLAEQPASIRKKERADTLARQRKFLRAIELYRQIIDRAKTEVTSEVFLGEVYNNIGVAYARLFQFEEATGAFRHACELLRSEGTLTNALLCARMHGGADAFEKMAREFAVEPGLKQKVETAIANLRPAGTPENMEKALDSWVRDYHRTTGLS